MPRKNKGLQLKFRKDRGTWEIGEYANRVWQRHTTGISSREEAEGIFAQVLIARAQPKSPRDPSQRKISDVLACYLTEHVPQTVMIDQNIRRCENLATFWGELTVSEVTKARCMEYMAARRKYKSLSDETIRADLQALRAALNHDYQESRLASVPSVWMPPKAQARNRWCSRKEVAALVRSARAEPKVRDYLPYFILIAYYSGQRKQAILHCRWHQVDLSGGFINWNETGRAVTNKRRPTQPIAPRMMTFLRILKKRGTDIGFVLNLHGKRIGELGKSFRQAAKRAKLIGVTPHTLSHSLVSGLLAKGVPVWEISKYTGKSEEVIRGTYGHFNNDYTRIMKALK